MNLWKGEKGMIFLAEETTTTTAFDWNVLWNEIIKWCTSSGLQLILGLVVLFILFKIVNIATRKLYKHLQKRQADETISRVGTAALRIGLKIMFLTFFVSYIGIETASISAVIASVGVGLSLALQGSLSNFAGGLILVVMRPFRLGDYITTNDQSGTVEDIHMFYTTLVTPDNKTVFVPNGSLANNVIVNVSVKDTRRVEVIMSVSYETNLDDARNSIRRVCQKNASIFADPAPYIEVSTYADSSIDLVIRVWCNSKDYWPVNKYLLEQIRVAFDEDGIDIPFNQLEIAIKNEK